MKTNLEYRYCGTVDSRYNLETDKNDGEMKNYFVSANFLSDSINSKNFKMDLYSDKKYNYEISWIAIE